jgi:hypothetical protein
MSLARNRRGVCTLIGAFGDGLLLDSVESSPKSEMNTEGGFAEALSSEATDNEDVRLGLLAACRDPAVRSNRRRLFEC